MFTEKKNTVVKTIYSSLRSESKIIKAVKQINGPKINCDNKTEIKFLSFQDMQDINYK